MSPRATGEAVIVPGPLPTHADEARGLAGSLLLSQPVAVAVWQGGSAETGEAVGATTGETDADPLACRAVVGPHPAVPPVTSRAAPRIAPATATRGISMHTVDRRPLYGTR